MLIDRREAVARIERDLGDASCLVCALLCGRMGPPIVLTEGRHTVSILPRYGLCAGHVVVLLREHVTRLTDVADEVWHEATATGLAIGRAVETALSPARCYVASLGSARRDVPMTSPHLHLQVVPVMDDDARPATVLTWEHGVYVLSDEEGARLRDRLAAHLPPTRDGG